MSRTQALIAIAILTVPVAARAQEPTSPTPTPIVPDINQRSGLFTRTVPITPSLPADPTRDYWQDTRWAKKHDTDRSNSVFDGGFYGRYKWRGDCTASFSPYFRGSPGQSTLDAPGCPPTGRLLGNMLHPFRPVSYYYAGGSYVPIYDLDAFVPGPGPWPWPRLYQRKSFGH